MYQRQFLNTKDRGGTAFVEASVAEPDKDGHFDATLKIADCTRIVDLDFNVYCKDSAENAITKARRVKRVVDAFVAQVVVQAMEVVE